MTTIKKGDKVNVYMDPFTVSDIEGHAVVRNKPYPTGDNDEKGRPTYHCTVMFDNESTVYFRIVSELAQ